MNCAALNENLLDDEMFGHEEGVVHRARRASARAASSTPTAARCSSTRSATCRWRCRRSCCACWRTARSSASAPTTRSRWTCGSSRRPTGTSRRRSMPGRFRRDLFYRLKVGTIRLPALRERQEDIPLLAAHFLKELAKKHGKPVPKVAAGGLEGVRGLRLAGQRPRTEEPAREHGRARPRRRARRSTTCPRTPA